MQNEKLEQELLDLSKEKWRISNIQAPGGS